MAEYIIFHGHKPGSRFYFHVLIFAVTEVYVGYVAGVASGIVDLSNTFFRPTNSWTQLNPNLIGSPNVCYASEKSTVDPQQRLMTLKTINLTFGSFLSVYETLSYVPHPTDPAKTLLKQEATVQVEGVPLNRYMEDVLTKNISTNAGKGRQGLEWVIGKLNAEMKELANSAATSTNEILTQTKKSLDDITDQARKSMDELSATAQKIHI
ncbi:protein slowmo-like isoform X2 [Anopheles albimanus]|uniref:protein slowmo-like isoform X2 n=1 Tax=Anopheles albimanus TaxID=7167 RepID=UPI00164175F4|nr:protein slowmo-like isoform X2 [Anopheles albimanus]